MNKQEIFNRVATHLLTQNAKSNELENPTVCLYRGANGTSCAIGCLITDEAYSVDLEGHGSASSTIRKALACSGIEMDAMSYDIDVISYDTDVELLRDLQYIHDAYEVIRWREKLVEIAEKHGLEFNA